MYVQFEEVKALCYQDFGSLFGSRLIQNFVSMTFIETQNKQKEKNPKFRAMCDFCRSGKTFSLKVIVVTLQKTKERN